MQTLSFGACTFLFPHSSVETFALSHDRVIVARPGKLERLLAGIPQEVEVFAKRTPFAVWEEMRSRLRCFSHPLGRGTFFYTWLNKCLHLSTSLPDLAAVLDTVRLDPHMVAEYFVLGRNTSCDQRRTFVQGVSQVPPGHCLEWDDGQLKITPYWSPQHDSLVGTLSLLDAVEYVRETLEKVIDESEPFSSVGCLVSGGLDSSLIAAIVQRRVKTLGSSSTLFTAGHQIDCSEERQLQQILVRHLRTSLVVPEQEFPKLQLEPLRALNRSANAPSGGLFTGIYMSIMEEAARRGITLLFGGEGGDEVFRATPRLLADLLLRHRWKAALQALIFFTSLDGDSNFLQMLAREGLLPILACSFSRPRNRFAQTIEEHMKKNIRNESNSSFLIRFLGAFNKELSSVDESVIEDLCIRQASGFSFSMYESYRQVLNIPYYEACWPYGEGGLGANVRVVNPLSDLRVFRAAMSLRLDQRVGTWRGFRSKYLLRLVAGNSLPQSLRSHSKIGVSNLVVQMTQGMENELVQLLQSDSLAHVGICPDPLFLDPRNVPTGVSLYWVLLLLLVIWFEELKNGVAQKRL